ncbi:MAG TPA: ABC transporter permease, partial [Pyrinomonadaceae bacterium]|nr:ABC transporter permease [Pyrinomonadaceae bacterium]
EVNGISRTVVGVMPPRSHWPDDAELWLPINFSASSPAKWTMRRDNMVWSSVARLREGATLEQARAVLGTIARRIEQEEPASRRGWSATAYPLREWIVGSTLRQTLWVLLGAVGFVLLIACVNIANLLLARGAAREREIAIRTALGAGRLHLIRQFLVESLILGLLGGAFGLLLAFWGVDLLVAIAPEDIPRLQEITINAPVLAFVITISLLTATAFGIIPALHATQVDLNESLKEGGRGSTGGAKRKRAQSVLVISEVALSMVLLVGAGLMIRSFTLLQRVDPGLNVDGLITFHVSLPRARYSEDAQVTNFYDGALERIRALPGVESAAATSALPLGGGGFYLGRVFLGEQHPEPPAGPDYPAQWNTISHDYFRVMGTPLLRGRAFDERDTEASAPVIIINETMARRMFPHQDPIGQRIRSWRDENVLREIVGVVSDVRYFGRDDELRSLVYIPLTQDTNRSMMIAVRTTGGPPLMIGSLREAVWSLDRNLAVADVQTMRQILNESVARPRFNMMLLGIFAAVAIILAAIGLYGILAYSVVQRTHEIGVRIALGAGSRDVLRLVVGQGLKLALVGLGIGLVAAYTLTRVMVSLLYGVSATDPLTFISVAVLLAAVALLASYVPARRATKVDPMVALRYE